MAHRLLLVAACALGLALLPVLTAGASGQGESGGGGPVSLQYAFWGDQNEINATNAYLNSYMAKSQQE